MYDNQFGEIFGDIFSYGCSASDWKDKLDEYWEHSKIESYHKTLIECKAKGFRVLRNSEGKHRVIEKR